MDTPPNKFIAHGHEWILHKPGDPCPVPPETRVFVHFAEGGVSYTSAKAKLWGWDNRSCSDNINGYRLADEQPQPAKVAAGDFGEPWRNQMGTVRDRMEFFVSLKSPETADRVISCVNACAGMADPVEEIAELKRRDQKWKDGIDECCGVKINYDPLDWDSRGSTLDQFVGGLKKEIVELRAALSGRTVSCGECNEMAKENEQMRAATTWQPIETAPRDGAVIQLAEPDFGDDWCIFSGFFEEGIWNVVPDCEQDRELQPTHWMPLPPAPATPWSDSPVHRQVVQSGLD